MTTNEFERAAAYLPPALQRAANGLPTSVRAAAQEIRLRVGEPLILSVGSVDRLIEGTVCTPADMAACFQRLCDHSVHSHQQELCRGFITTADGCRAGVAGTSVMENGQVVSLRNITSLCLRVARRHEGCAMALLPHLVRDGRVRATLLVGEPACGKTSLLRDAAAQLSNGYAGRRFRVAVVDERGELSGGRALPACDVLCGYPKAVGIEQAVRCLSPEIVMFDELGGVEELAAVTDALHSGVAAVATAHGREPSQLLHRRGMAEALRMGVFEQMIWLGRRDRPGQIVRVCSAKELLE